MGREPLSGSSLTPEVGKLQNPLSCRQRCPQHNTKKHNTKRERSRTAVGTLQVYLTRFRSKDLIFGWTGHQAPADGSCAHGTDQDSPCDSTFLWDCYTSTVWAGCVAIPQAAPVYPTGNARACIPTGSWDWCPPRDGEHWLKLASHFSSYLSSSSRRDPRAAPLQAFPESPQHFQSRFQLGSWDAQHRFHGN